MVGLTNPEPRGDPQLARSTVLTAGVLTASLATAGAAGVILGVPAVSGAQETTTIQGDGPTTTPEPVATAPEGQAPAGCAGGAGGERQTSPTVAAPADGGADGASTRRAPGPGRERAAPTGNGGGVVSPVGAAPCQGRAGRPQAGLWAISIVRLAALPTARCTRAPTCGTLARPHRNMTVQAHVTLDMSQLRARPESVR